jgi:hypothetical protein
VLTSFNVKKSFFEENNVEPLYNITNLCEESIQMYIKLFLILYADDTALMAESSDGLQKNVFINTCIYKQFSWMTLFSEHNTNSLCV